MTTRIKIKERPILFKGEMVRAILDGSKTQTRRVAKMRVCGGRRIEVPTSGDAEWVNQVAHNPYGKPGDRDWSTGLPPKDGMYYVRGLLNKSIGGDNRAVWVDPYYFTWGFSDCDDPESIGLDSDITPENMQWKQPGDMLWVRETWAVSNIYDKLAPSAICKDLPKGPNHAPTKVLYPSTDRISEGIKRRQSIFMPRWASRILLEVTDVRVERLNAISDADALAEGCLTDSMLSGDCLASVYARLWESINGEGSWEANPWVWVIGFRRVQL
jgi:hypothetical protein